MNDLASSPVTESAESQHANNVDIASYMESFFPGKFPQSTLASLSLDMLVAFDIQGPRGGQWSCEWRGGNLVRVSRGLRSDVELTYVVDTTTFTAVVCGHLAPHDAFFAHQIEISGNIEKALKLAILFGQFVHEHPFRPHSCREEVQVVTCRG
jgi:hypothetical protein